VRLLRGGQAAVRARSARHGAEARDGSARRDDHPAVRVGPRVGSAGHESSALGPHLWGLSSVGVRASAPAAEFFLTRSALRRRTCLQTSDSPTGNAMARGAPAAEDGGWATTRHALFPEGASDMRTESTCHFD